MISLFQLHQFEFESFFFSFWNVTGAQTTIYERLFINCNDHRSSDLNQFKQSQHILINRTARVPMTFKKTYIQAGMVKDHHHHPQVTIISALLFCTLYNLKWINADSPFHTGHKQRLDDGDPANPRKSAFPKNSVISLYFNCNNLLFNECLLVSADRQKSKTDFHYSGQWSCKVEHRPLLLNLSDLPRTSTWTKPQPRHQN